MARVEFFAPGLPVGKGRPRATVRSGVMRLYTPARTRTQEAAIALAARLAMVGRSVILGPVRTDMVFVLPVPASWPKRRQALARNGAELPAKKPDLDNLEKLVLDALNGIVWRDDAQVVEGTKRKIYGDAPGVTVTVEEVAP
ncbi:RusA family crossover junction endodeoxyribonuclease [Novispirillum itersonii]|uniref:RusA family crossover junction endodeoxyribonuclease n=1 Tax=Novispirillum itersonii TaxID=189 RepID=UPI00036BA021|nr:RusA family crossover junction endodeoxyribonuclease [Novispirillum itersonii]